MSKPFLIIQLRPEDETADNEFQAIKNYAELQQTEVVRMRVEKNGFFDINLEEFTGIIVGGSPFDVSTQDDQKSAIQIDIESAFNRLFDDVVEQDFPFLGCCSGNSLLGSYCGSNISSKYAEPVGGIDVIVTEDGKKEPLLKDMPDRFRVLSGHKEACDTLPSGCVLLITNASCPVQMFRLKRNIFATQFHPEGDVAGFTLRINSYKNHGYFPAESADQLIQSIEGESTPYAHLILQRFVQRYRQL